MHKYRLGRLGKQKCMSEQRSVMNRLLKKYQRPAAAVVLSAAALSATGCGILQAPDKPNHPVEHYQQPKLKNHNVVIIGDSETEGVTLEGNLAGQFKYIGYNLIKADFAVGHSLTDGTPDSGVKMIARDANAIRHAGVVILQMGTNPRGDMRVSAQDFEDQALFANKLIHDINPNAQRFMVDIAVDYKPYSANYSLRNKGMYAGSTNKQFGYGVIPMYYAMYHGNPEHIDPSLSNPSIDSDWRYHVHAQDPAGWRSEAHTIVASVASAGSAK